MLRTSLVLVVAAVCLARPSKDQLGVFPADDRAVRNPKTPNQILDNVLEGAVENMRALGWCSSKRVRNAESNLPFDVNDGAESSSEKFSISTATITGLCSLTRSKSASFNADQSVLTGTVMLENTRLLADYTVDFAGVGEAPAQTVSGSVTERVDKLFADIQINLADLVPQSIKSYTVRSGHDVLEAATNLDNNDMKGVHSAGFRKALLEELDSTMATNVKVQINKSIQAISA